METKVCGKCKQEKPISEFYKHKRDGYQSQCKTCRKEVQREYAKTGYFTRYQSQYEQKPKVKKRIAEYRKKPRVKIKNMARWYTNHEIRAGRINREPCAMCNKEQAEAHHLDYNQPLLIVWLCPDCHRKVHLKKGGVMNKPDEGLLTPERRKEIIETWHLTVQPYLDGLNSIEAEEKLKELPDVYELLVKAQHDLTASIKDAEHQSQIDKIFEEIRKRLEMVKQELCFGGNWEAAKETIDRIQALKSRIMGGK